MKYVRSFRHIGILFLVMVVAACGGGGGGGNGGDGPAVTPPPALAAPALADLATQVFVANALVDSISFTNTGGGELTACSAEGLPQDITVALSANASTCELSGIASLAQAATNFSVTATNASGTSTASGTIQIDEATAFITKWKTDNPFGVSEDNQITLSTSPAFSYNYTVDWGDGNTDENVTGDITHTYATPGEYTVAITGNFPQPFFTFDGEEEVLLSDSSKLLSVEQWGNRPWLSMEQAFLFCENLVINDTQLPDFSRVESMRMMFFGASDFNSDISDWDVSHVSDMSDMFLWVNGFNGDLSAWNVSNVTNMSGMFLGARSFNADISAWNVSNVTNMRRMFAGASSFNADISAWNVSNVENMQGMFSDAKRFNAEINQWDVSRVTDFSSMFAFTDDFNQNIEIWNVSSALNMESMFRNATSFDQNIGGWDISSVTNMSEMLEGNVLSLENYNSLLIGWAAQGVQPNVNFGAGSAQFSAEAQDARNLLTDAFGWTIEDGGLLVLAELEAVSMTAYTKNEVIFPINNNGGNADQCTSSDLPAGLSVQVTSDGSSCEIVGTPVVAQASTQANITTTNKIGSTSSTIDITILQETPFITRWKTDNPGASANDQITIKVSPDFDYDFSVDWGDGNVDNNITADITHTYAVAGEYVVSITGKFPQPFFINTFDASLTDSPKLLAVEQWGQRSWLSMKQAFFNCVNLVINDLESPDLTFVKSMASMFTNADNLSGEMNNWDVSTVTDISSIFNGADKFDVDVSNWNVSNVENMAAAFSNGSFNQDISNWDVSSVTSMNSMFRNASKFNQDIGSWNVSKVRSMSSMFENADGFNQDIGAWDVSGVQFMTSMFENTALFNQDIGAWNVSNVINMQKMFRENRVFNQDIGNWNVSKVLDMSDMFFDANAFNANIGGWDVSNATNMSRMFRQTDTFDQDISQWNVSKVRNMEDMFAAGALSTPNYDAILTAWSQLESLVAGVKFSAGSTTLSPESQAAKDKLVNDFGWVITDGGQVTPAP
ncbi:BspA family leucine-rich repeat surface protein [Simiduia curdlanivorans]|uniref:BspA family leucine-rich repeat surface protein n=1 Tax=Simiduia curdlanivorans TaxID=1492769 RepID=A0ABV8V3J9_9GAMM|nr:BspA family leucine-rich repeat surface protein [Simiduia curdlanivorans]MDN3637537.1 BspA family leucine-rich repeat surface protein [Simiduia curdlanivorans]